MDEVCLYVGEAAGHVYRLLEKGGSNMTNIKKVLKESGFDSQMALMAIGWLARENKICIQKNGNVWSVELL